MDHVRLKAERRLNRTFYGVLEHENDDLFLISMFLTDDVGPYDGPDFWIEWIRRPDSLIALCNYCTLEKRDDCVILGRLFSEELNDPGVRMLAFQLIYLLEQWKQVWEHKPDEVIITRENDIYQVIQKNNDMSQA